MHLMIVSPAAAGARATIVRALFVTLCLCVPGSVAGQTTTNVAEVIGDGIVRLYASEDARSVALPSMALERPWPAIAGVEPDVGVEVEFTRIRNRHSVRIRIADGTSLYGTGEVPGPLLRNGRRTLLWNYDAYGWNDATPGLYQSHPWVLAVRADGSSYGVLFDTAYRSSLDLQQDIVFVADGPMYPVIVIERDTPQRVVQALTDLTGRIDLPPLWSMGYHQCRYSYYPDAQVRAIAREFRERQIPCDVIWMDIDYMDGFRSFTFDPDHFPNPAGTNAFLHENGFHSVWMIDPGIKRDPGYHVYDSGTERDVWVRDETGKPFIGDVWPGACVFPDFTSADVRDWWAGLYEDFAAQGVDGVWNDMNEPAVFNSPGKTMPHDNQHRADAAFGGPGPAPALPQRLRNADGARDTRGHAAREAGQASVRAHTCESPRRSSIRGDVDRRQHVRLVSPRGVDSAGAESRAVRTTERRAGHRRVHRQRRR